MSVFLNAGGKGVATTVGADTTTNITLNPRLNIAWLATETGVSSITNTNLDHCDSGAPAQCANVPYSVAAGALTVESGVELHVASGKTFAPGGAVTANGSIHIVGIYDATNTTVTLGGSGTVLTVAGTFTTTGSTVVYACSAACDAATTTYNHVTVNAPGVNVTLNGSGTTNTDGNFYLQNGTFDRNGASCGGFGCQVSSIKGHLTTDAGTTLGTSIARWIFNGTAQNITVSGSGGFGFLTVGTTTTNPTVTLQTNVSAVWGLEVGTSTASTGILNTNGFTLTVSNGDVTVFSGGTFQNASGTLSISGVGGPRVWTDSTAAGQNFGAVNVGSASNTVNLGSNITASSITVPGGTFEVGTRTLTAANVTISGGTLSMTGSGGVVKISGNGALSMSSGSLVTADVGTAPQLTTADTGTPTYVGVSLTGGTVDVSELNTSYLKSTGFVIGSGVTIVRLDRVTWSSTNQTTGGTSDVMLDLTNQSANLMGHIFPAAWSGGEYNVQLTTAGLIRMFGINGAFAGEATDCDSEGGCAAGTGIIEWIPTSTTIEKAILENVNINN